jgi:hypothetical protein
VRALPLPVALTVRLLPVAVLACAGWAYSSGPMSTPDDTGSKAAPQPSAAAPDGPSERVAARTYTQPPAPCGTVAEKTVKKLVPGAKTAGKELSATDESVRRGCSWSALDGYDYRWLDVTFEVKRTDELARQGFAAGAKSSDGALKGLGDEARLSAGLTKKDGQQTQEAVVAVRRANVIVTVTFNGSDFESKGAPAAGTMSDGAEQAARDALAGLGSGKG